MTWLIDLDATRDVVAGGAWAGEALTHGRIAEAAGAFTGQSDGAGLGDGDLPAVLRVSAPLPDLARLRMGLLVASDALRAAVEAAEPGRHRLWPLSLRDSYGAARSGRHGLIPRAVGSALRECGSALRVEPPVPDLGLPRRVTLRGGPVAVDPACLPRAHLWWDHGLNGGMNGMAGRPYLLCSDALARRLSGLRLPPMRRCAA